MMRTFIIAAFAVAYSSPAQGEHGGDTSNTVSIDPSGAAMGGISVGLTSP